MADNELQKARSRHYKKFYAPLLAKQDKIRAAELQIHPGKKRSVLVLYVGEMGTATEVVAKAWECGLKASVRGIAIRVVMEGTVDQVERFLTR